MQMEYATLCSSLSATITRDSKTEIWQRITEKVNSCGVALRTRPTHEVKEKWRALKGSVLNKKREEKKTGGGPAPAPVPFEHIILLNAHHRGKIKLVFRHNETFLPVLTQEGETLILAVPDNMPTQQDEERPAPVKTQAKKKRKMTENIQRAPNTENQDLMNDYFSGEIEKNKLPKDLLELKIIKKHVLKSKSFSGNRVETMSYIEYQSLYDL
ncbi:hypothetical protein BaRGS_00032713 [Batillaria attramentaria]|uniref:Myb/SANT-like DNA-binding domain-containing protein n=1 Tax=Batillaria attramentaria TaxID=370345 RepID=A0ABD0JN14_9CAEN